MDWSRYYATVNPVVLHLQNPQFQPPRIPGQIRTRFDLPTLISPATSYARHAVQLAARPAERFFLIHYSIAIAPGAGPRAQWVSLESQAGCIHCHRDDEPTRASRRSRRGALI
jgi:hypothetical protein